MVEPSLFSCRAAGRRARPHLALLALCGLLLAPLAMANEARPASDDPALEARMRDIASELRCVVCQNQTVADSHAELAADLRQQIREQLAAGQSSEQVLAFMTARYGDFVLYRPPLNPRTLLLWWGPALLLLGSLLGLAMLLRRRSRLGDDAFDPDTEEPAATRAD